MPGPLFTTLIAIPWAELLKQAPAIVKAADSLLSGTWKRKIIHGSSGELAVLKERVAALEEHDQEDAKLVKQLAEQLEVLTFSTRVLASRLKVAMGLAAAGFLFGVGAMVVCFLFR